MNGWDLESYVSATLLQSSAEGATRYDTVSSARSALRMSQGLVRKLDIHGLSPTSFPNESLDQLLSERQKTLEDLTLHVHAPFIENAPYADYDLFAENRNFPQMQVLAVSGCLMSLASMHNFSNLRHLDLVSCSKTRSTITLDQLFDAMDQWVNMEELQIIDYLASIDTEQEPTRHNLVQLPKLKRFTIEDDVDNTTDFLDFMQFLPTTKVTVVLACEVCPDDTEEVFSVFSNLDQIPVVREVTFASIHMFGEGRIYAHAPHGGSITIELQPKQGTPITGRLFDSTLHRLGEFLTTGPGKAEHPLLRLECTGFFGPVSQHNWLRALRAYPNLEHLIAVDPVWSGKCMQNLLWALNQPSADERTVVCHSLELLHISGAEYTEELLAALVATLQLRLDTMAMLVTAELTMYCQASEEAAQHAAARIREEIADLVSTEPRVIVVTLDALVGANLVHMQRLIDANFVDNLYNAMAMYPLQEIGAALGF